MILYGPPGVGKTTLARIVAETTGAAFEELSAVSARVDDVRGVLQRARDRLGANGARTILFLDEIHRFNKGQQDALLPGVESGLLTLIGATTENPYFEVNAALLSRCAVVELEPLSDDEVAAVVGRGAAELGIEVPADVVEAIVRKAGGDARSALGTLELSWQTATRRGRAARGPPRRRRSTQAPAPLRPRRRPALRHRLRVHQVDARQRPRRRRLLPRRDARGRRGRPLHRPADGDPRLRGHRQRRSAGAPRRRRGGAGARARRPARGAAEPRAGGDLPRQRAEVERLGAGRSGRRAAEVRERGIQPPPAGAPRRALRRRAHARATARATSRPTTTRSRPRPTTSPTASRAGPTMFPPATERRAVMAVGTGEQAPEFDLEEAYDKPRLRLRGLPRQAQRPARLPPVRLHGGLPRGGARSPGQPRVVPQRRDRRDLRLVRHVGRAPGMEAGARRHVRVRLRLLAARRRRPAPTGSSTRRPAPRGAARS